MLLLTHHRTGFLAIVALAIIIIANIWGKGMIKIIPILLGVVGSYVFALILNAFGVKNPDGFCYF